MSLTADQQIKRDEAFEQKSKHILVVDDEDSLRQLLATVLSEKGCVVSTAPTAEEGLSILRSAVIDTALVDLVLPGIGGLQFLKHVKRDYPDMEVVMMSSHASLETSIEALRDGAYDFLIKPFDDIEEAWFAVQRALEKKHLAEQNRRLISDLKEYRDGLEKEVALRTEALARTVEKMQEEISARKAAEGQLQHDALHDALTGLPNRALFNDRLSHTILMAQRRKDYIYAVLFVDLDRFKVINDSLGHHIGDQLLIAFGQRLMTYLRPHDTVARLGGDEFSILFEDIGGIGNATDIADRIGAAMRAPFTLNDREVYATASIGIALCAGQYEHPDQILRDADTAMYKAKANGRAQYAVFEPGMHTHAVARLHLETDLRKAIERKEFIVFYQPILSLTTNSIVGFEALVRWQHPERGLLNPEDFLKMADETGMSVSIDRLVLREACRQMQEWMGQYSRGGLSFISTNLSNKQMVQPDLVDYVDRVLKETGLNSKNLKLEITEDVIMENPDKMVALLTRLKALGVQIYIDDFGTGYSSLSHLHRLPIDGLKIDRSFIKRMGDHGENQEIVRTIMLLARDLNIGVIAEGVETAKQMGHIKSLGCEQGQGNLFSKPVDGDSARTLLGNTETAHA